MELCQVMLEAHHTGATIYMVGMLTNEAALRAESIVASLARTTRVVRLDLRGIEIIDPSAFVLVARALNRWRDSRRGRLAIQFPERSTRPRRRGTHLVDQPSMMTTAVSAAITCPMNTSPG
jgi:ABC-type transporter Mla MlaB component